MLPPIDYSRSFDFEERLPDGSRVRRRAVGKTVAPTGVHLLVDENGRVYAPSLNSPLQHVRVPKWETLADTDDES